MISASASTRQRKERKMNATVSILQPRPDDLVRAAADLAPALRARAEQADRECRVPDTTVAEMRRAGLFRVLQPRRHGGYELDPAVFFDVQMELARACMSTAWIYGVIAVHNWQLALFDPRAQEDVWGNDDNVLISSSYMPKAKVTPAPGGYRISGRWGFSSGVDHCDWLFLGGLLSPPEGGAPDYVTFLVPKADAIVHPVWDTIGLRGTGSHDVEVVDAFVPDYRIHRSRDGAESSSPGLAFNSSPIYRLPFGQIFVRAVSTSSIGALAGATDALRAYASKRVSSNDMSRTALDPSVQSVVAEATAAIDECRLILHRNLARMMDLARAGKSPDLEERLLFRMQAATTVDRCADLISRMFYSCGAQGVYRTGPVARTFVDIHTGRTHVANNPDKFTRNFGGVLLGETNSDTFI
jgi:3-hydroxy-9,10-secoandrosta-1,3,5(10)-triene-9,17-dione monooxygenase